MKFRGAVYRSPAPGLPDLAIILREDGEILLCRAVHSVEEGEAVLDIISRGLDVVASQDEHGPFEARQQ
jgi:hypothetical protein